MSEWQLIETAPKDVPFLAVNHDKEVFVAKYSDGRLAFRTHKLMESRTWEVRRIDGEEWLREDKSSAVDEWRNDWTLWTKGYEFAPTHWLPLPNPPRNKHGIAP